MWRKCAVGRRRWICLALTAVLGALLVQGQMDIALAHKGKLPKDALTLVRQAAALLAQDPRMIAEVRERLDAALQSADSGAVDLAKVRQARDALAAGDILAARRALVDAIGAGTPSPPGAPARSVPLPRSGATPGTMPVGPPSPEPGGLPQQQPAAVAMKMAEPLTTRFGGTSAEVATVLVGLALIAVGLVVLRPGR